MKIEKKKRSGFTIVEMVVVISVIGILAGVTLVGYGNWRERSAKSEVKSDLLQVATSMKNAKNFGNGFPSAIPTDFKSSPEVTITLANSTSNTYCINGVHAKYSGIQMSISSTSDTQPRDYLCS